MKKITFQLTFLTSVFILLLAAFLTYRTLVDFERDSLSVVHTQRVKDQLANLVRIQTSFSRQLRNVTLSLENVNMDDVEKFNSDIRQNLAVLDSLVSDNHGQQKEVAILARLTDEHLKIVDELVILMSSEFTLTDDIIESISNEESKVGAIVDQADVIRGAENKLLIFRSLKFAESKRWVPIMLLILVGIAVLVLLILFMNTFSLYKSNQIKAQTLAVKLDELLSETKKSKKLQNLLQGIFDGSQHGIIAFQSVRNDDGEIVDFEFSMINEEGGHVLGHTPEYLKGKRMLDIVPGNLESGLFEEYTKVVETSKSYRSIQHYDYDSIESWFDISAVKNGDGFVVTFLDVTESKKYEKEILIKQEELEKTNYELEQFAYIASHDLQEPLRKIRTFGDRLTGLFSAVLDQKGKDYIMRMQNAASRMQTLIDDLLKFSRVSRGETKFSAVDLNLVVNDALYALDLSIKEKNAQININELPEINGNSSQLTQLFQNLISNSLKYSKEDVSPEILITAESIKKEELGQPKDFWKISIIDNGIGFDESYAEQIFIIFQRLHGRSEYSGTGIGLAICEKIVTTHNGYIEAISSPGNGATFIIYLPKENDERKKH